MMELVGDYSENPFEGNGNDIPIYPILMLFYFKKLIFNDFDFEFTFIEEYLLYLSIILIGAIFNIANITTLGNSTIVFTFIVLLPFFIGFLYSLPQTNLNSWIDPTPQNEDNEYQFGLFLATMLWLHTGWDSTGCLSAEIGCKKSNFFKAFIVAIIVDYIGYTIPVLGALTIDCNDDTNSCWDDGYLYTAYHKILPGLGLAVAVAGFIANFSLFIAEISVQARAFWALAQPFVLLTENGKMYIQTCDGIIYDDDMEIIDSKFIECEENVRKIHIGMLPQWLCGTIWNKTGAPVRGVILQSLISSILVTFDFEFLLQASVLINCITWCTELMSFLRLRYTEPNTLRPYKVPGGMFVAWLITVVKCMLVFTLFVLVIYDHPWYIFVTIAFFIFTIVYYMIYCKYYEKKYKNQDGLRYGMVELQDSSKSTSKTQETQNKSVQ